MLLLLLTQRLGGNKASRRDTSTASYVGDLTMPTEHRDIILLEAEVSDARTRLAQTIERLVDPTTKQQVRDELTGYKERALHKKDELLQSANDKAQGIWGSLKERALQHPLGIALIAAGLGYRLYRHPPLATLLVGGGLTLLLRANKANRRPVGQVSLTDPTWPPQESWRTQARATAVRVP
jgi:hypothetical protein